MLTMVVMVLIVVVIMIVVLRMKELISVMGLVAGLLYKYS